MDEKNLQELLNEVGKVCLVAEQDKKARQSRGEYYNVFNVLGLWSEEVRLHSAFIANLLNPKGNHGVGGKFLKAFLRRTGTDEDYIDVDKVNPNIVERNIGYKDKDDTKGGRIDIIIEDGTRAVIIENKIYAGDQRNQLSRYDNYGKEHFPRGFKMIYLTLDGHDPSERSTGKKEIDYKLLSYRDDIFAWLTDCVKIAFDRPLVRETINQYIQLIKQLTGMNMEDNYLKKVAEIASSVNNVDSTVAIIEVQSQIPNIIRQRYIFEPLKNFAEGNGYLCEIFEEDVPYIKISLPEWKRYINIFANRSKEDGSWKYMIIGISYFEEQEINTKLDCLEEKATEWWPFGWENLPVNDWEAPSSFKQMASGEVVNWLKNKIEEIMDEVAKKELKI